MINYLDVFSYMDYRVFLADYYAARKAVDLKFSYRFFAKQAGYTSSGLYTNIVNGKLHLSQRYLPGFIQALKLNIKEAAYFEFMVDYTHAQTDQDREMIFDQMVPFVPIETRRLRLQQRDFYTKWYHSSILLLLEMDDYSDNLKELSVQLIPKVTLPQCKAAIKLLADLELIHQMNGSWKPKVFHSVAGKDFGKEVIRHHQREMMALASDALEEFSPQERFITTQAISLSDEALQRVKKEVTKCQDAINVIVRNDQSPSRVYHMNLQLFPTSELKVPHEV
tara:strand:- start:1056 stop:1895 length:840 start_codon:yes stop_codon:yes gene_type:complete